ncbi:hypothetical protein QYF36_016019 [Acer negundo]|nr:hypothetical protein QYF36_016019 [Acer negundo]
MRQQLTKKSDVYSFGVVLFEIICARPALDTTLVNEQINLAEWANRCHQKGILDQIVDPYLEGKIAPECFKKFAEMALKCVSNQGIERPSMGEVLCNLECALQLQESAERGTGGKMDIQEGSSSMQNLTGSSSMHCGIDTECSVLSDHGSNKTVRLQHPVSPDIQEISTDDGSDTECSVHLDHEFQRMLRSQ